MFFQNMLGENGMRALFMGLLLFVFYIFILRPKRNEENKRTSFIDTLKIGTEIITIGGLYGRVVQVNEATVVIETDAKGSQITLAKQAISKRKPPLEKKKQSQHTGENKKK